MSTALGGTAEVPEEVGPNDEELRGVPEGLLPPNELAAQHPDTPWLISYSRISDDWRKHSRKRAASSAWKPGKGVANQHRRNAMNAARHGVIIVQRYTDNDISAFKNSERPDFKAMLQDLRRGYTPHGYRVDGVIVVDQDRVQRTQRDWEEFVDALTMIPTRRFWTPSGPMDLTDEGEIIKTGVMAVVNKAESLKKKRRITDWHQDRILDGLPHSGPRPFGWDDDKINLRPAEAEFLAWAIRERIKGKSMGTLVAEARRRGLKGTKGGDINTQTLTQMMTAPRVCGYRANRGDLVLDDTGAPIVGIWKTIVTPEEWRAVCATFGDGSTYAARGAGTPRITGIPKTVKYLCSTLLRCVRRLEDGRVCNTAMAGTKANSKRSPYNYKCSGCRKNVISGPMVDAQVEKLLMAKLTQAAVTYKPPELVWPLESTLREKADKLATLEQNWLEGTISDEMFYRLVPKLDQEVKNLRRERARWEHETLAGQENPTDVMRKWKSGEYDLAQKRKVLFEVFAAIQVEPGEKGNKMPNPKRLTPVWRS